MNDFETEYLHNLILAPGTLMRIHFNPGATSKWVWFWHGIKKRIVAAVQYFCEKKKKKKKKKPMLVKVKHVQKKMMVKE